jgi:hypothetical protein
MGASTVELKALTGGHLQAIGLTGQPILFTSVTNTGPAQWSGLVFDGGTGNLDYVTVRYGGQAGTVSTPGFSGGNITVRNVTSGQVSIQNSRVMSETATAGSSADFGLYVENSLVAVNNTVFQANGNTTVDTAVFVNDAAGNNVTFTNNTLQGNGGYALRIPLRLMNQATGNTFSSNGFNRIQLGGGNLAIATTLGPQTGLEAYEVLADATVQNGVTLTVQPATTVMAAS